MIFDAIVGVVGLIVGGLIGYIIAAHNSKANKEQVAALEAKLATVAAKVEDKASSVITS